MWRLKSVAILVMALAVLIVGTVAAQAGWWWNSMVDVEGTQIRTIWQVDDDGGANDYQTTIKILVPTGVSASVVEQATTETVQIMKTGGFVCDAAGGTVGAEVWYKIRALNGAEGTQAHLSVDLADGTVLASGDTTVGGGFTKLGAVIPVSGLTCD